MQIIITKFLQTSCYTLYLKVKYFHSPLFPNILNVRKFVTATISHLYKNSK